MRAVALLALIALAGVASVSAKHGSGDGYSWDSDDGAFAIDSFTMTSQDGSPFAAGTICDIVITGTTSKVIVAGTLKWKVYEEYMQYFVASGNSPYFTCDNKGCDPTKPVALSLQDPTSGSTNFTINTKYTMPAPHKDGAFRLVMWGEDQDHFPYDFSSTTLYNISMTPTTAVKELIVAAPMDDPQESSWTDGAFKLDSAVLSTENNHWKAGAQATITLKGTVDDKKILAGAFQYKIYEYEEQYFVDSGNAEYFHCDNKGCDTSNPIALTLDDPTNPDSTFTGVIPYTMPRAKKSGIFRFVVWGVDQDHSPYDFSATVGYNYTHGLPAMEHAEEKKVAFAAAELPAPEDDPFDATWDNGTFMLSTATLSTASGSWSAGASATITMTGSVSNKTILAGAFQYKIYEYSVQYFVDSGNSDYFHCDNKGCDTSNPISLSLDNPTDPNTQFTGTVQFVMPKAEKTGVFRFVLWGVDQDHSPYDFSATIGYNFTSAAV